MERLSFENLTVRRKALAFANRMYEVTRGFPGAEQLGLAGQMRRAGVSIAADIAEGASRSSLADQARFAEIAYGSLCEVTTMLHVARSQTLLKPKIFEEFYASALELCRLISGFRKSMTARARSSGKRESMDYQLSTVNYQLVTHRCYR